MSNISDQHFIRPEVDITDGPDLEKIVNLPKAALRERWATEHGRAILRQMKESGLRREVLLSLVGRYYGQIDLRGIDLSGMIVKKQDLSMVDLYASRLVGTVFDQVDLHGSWLSESDIRGAKFRWSKMDDVLIDNVEFDNRTEFLGVDLNKINFTLASLVRELAISQQRIEHLEKRHPYIAAAFKITSDYGRSLLRWSLWMVGIIALFGMFFWLWPGAISEEGPFNAIYFSFVTFTTLGYGDILPLTTVAKIAVMLEAMFGYLMGGMLIAILARKVMGD